MSNKKHAVSFIKPADPSFLRKMKEQLGYKEGPTVDTKKEQNEDFDENDFKERDDEKPTVVALKPGDLTQEEAERLGVLDESNEEESSGKITFTKPTKRPAEDEGSSTKRKITSTSRQVNSKSLLSFDEEEDDD